MRSELVLVTSVEDWRRRATNEGGSGDDLERFIRGRVALPTGVADVLFDAATIRWLLSECDMMAAVVGYAAPPDDVVDAARRGALGPWPAGLPLASAQCVSLYAIGLPDGAADQKRVVRRVCDVAMRACHDECGIDWLVDCGVDGQPSIAIYLAGYRSTRFG